MRVVDLHVMDVNERVQTVFSGLSPLVMEDVADEGERIVVRARTPLDTAVCPVCRASSGRVHGYHLRTVADVPVDGRRVVVRVRVRRLVCPMRGCRHTFREQAPGVLERYQRRTARLTRQVKAVVKELAGRAGSRLLAILTAGLARVASCAKWKSYFAIRNPPPVCLGGAASTEEHDHRPPSAMGQSVPERSFIRRCCGR